MSCPASEEIGAAPPPPVSPPPPQDESNGGAAHAESDAERMETESEADGKKQFDKSTGKKRKYSLYLVYTEVKRWTTGEDSMLDPAEIKREIYMLMKKFMQDSRLMQTPAHEQLKVDMALWKV